MFLTILGTSALFGFIVASVLALFCFINPKMSTKELVVFFILSFILTMIIIFTLQILIVLSPKQASIM